MKHHALPEFWSCYRALPESIQKLADKNFELLKSSRDHPALRFKRAGDLWSVRVGLHYRALARNGTGGIYRFWIGHHSEYDRFLK